MTVPTSACARDKMRRSKREQHGLSMPNDRALLVWRPLYPRIKPGPGRDVGGIVLVGAAEESGYTKRREGFFRAVFIDPKKKYKL